MPKAAFGATVNMYNRPRSWSWHRRASVLGTALLVVTLAACGAVEPEAQTLLSVTAWGLPVETICLDSAEAFEDMSNATPFTDRLASGIDRIRNEVGTHFLEPRVADSECDITVELAVTGRAIPTEYTGTFGLSSITLYLGWDVAGTITVSAPGQDPVVVAIEDRRDPPQQTAATTGDAGQPKDAIDRAVDEGDWCSSFWDLFGGRTSDWSRGICL